MVRNTAEVVNYSDAARKMDVAAPAAGSSNVDDQLAALMESEKLIIQTMQSVGRGLSDYGDFISKCDMSLGHVEVAAMNEHLEKMMSSVFALCRETNKFHLRADRVSKRRGKEYTMAPEDKEGRGGGG